MTYSKKLITLLVAISLLLFTSNPAVLTAQTFPEPEIPDSLAIVRLKITGDEYIEIQNNSGQDIDDLSVYSLTAYNKVNSAASDATASSQAFPALKLKQDARMLLSSSIRPTCGASFAGKLSLSLVDGGGTLQIIKTSDLAGKIETIIADSVNWSSSSIGAIPLVPSFSKSPLATYYRHGLEDESYAWQKANQDVEDACKLVIPATTSSPVIPLDLTAPDQPHAGTFTVGLEEPDTEERVSSMDPNYSLSSIVISEILPNPVGTGNDDSDEYIELYNPNSAAFDLSGYKLRSGISALRYYTFPPGSWFAAGSYLVLSATTTGLALSNTSGQVALLDPDGSPLAITDIYRSAKDGQSWLRHNDVWQWSVTPTPGKVNVVTTPATLQKQTSLNAGNTKKPAKSPGSKPLKKQKAPKAVKSKKEKKAKAEKPVKLQTTPTAATVESRPIQSRVIAIIALIALLYGAYEYRGDLANKYQQCRRHIGSWRPRRRSVERR